MDVVDGGGRGIDARVDVETLERRVEGGVVRAWGGRPRAASGSSGRQLFRGVLGNHLYVRHQAGERARRRRRRRLWSQLVAGGAVAGGRVGLGTGKIKEQVFLGLFCLVRPILMKADAFLF
jgi:hypothetical protein